MYQRAHQSRILGRIKKRKPYHFFLICQTNLEEWQIHVHTVHAYTISPDVGQRLEKSCIHDTIHACLDMHEQRMYVPERCFQIASSSSSSKDGGQRRILLYINSDALITRTLASWRGTSKKLVCTTIWRNLA